MLDPAPALGGLAVTRARRSLDDARVALVIGSLGAGGAERVMALLVSEWAARGRSVTLITFGADGDGDFFQVDDRVKRIYLGAQRVASNPFKGANTLRQIVALRRALDRLDPDLVISFIVKTNVLTLLATRGTGVPVVVSDRLDPRAHPLGPAWRVLRRILYSRATRVVAQTQVALSFFPRAIRTHGQVIPNPVSAPPGDITQSSDASGHRIVGLGRLHEQKGFDLLIRAFADARAIHPDWTLEIWGEGPERSTLERLVVDLGLEDAVRLPGITLTPYDVLRAADLFVLSSRREGFPNALCEAMACGVAVVSFDCPSGPRDIIRQEVDGLLVPPEDTGALGAGMKRLMSDEEERRRLAPRGPDVVDRFSVARVIGLWDQVVSEALRTRTDHTKRPH